MGMRSRKLTTRDDKDAHLTEGLTDQKGRRDDQKPTLADTHPEKGGWLERRERSVRAALEDEDVEELGKIAALPGGFATNELRKEAWDVLLRTPYFFPAEEISNGGKDDKEAKPGLTDTTTNADDNVTDQRTEKGFVLKTEEKQETGSETGTKVEETSEASISSAAGKESEPTLSQKTEGIAAPDDLDSTLKPHPDENQVLLDTKRSFVAYPKGLPVQSKLAMQADLQALIVHVLRLYPSLSYFQGFHDIMSVLYLTFIPLPPQPAARSRSASIRSRDRTASGRATPFNGALTPAVVKADGSSAGDEAVLEDEVDEKLQNLNEQEKPAGVGEKPRSTSSSRGRRVSSAQRPPPIDRETPVWLALKRCAVVVSLCRVRDAMGSGMEPMMGMLKILQRLLHAADPELSRFSAAISPVPTLPFFALSWILCLFSHDIDTLDPVQRMFDFLLSRNPVSAIYLAVAIMIAKKDQMFALARKMGPEAEDDPSLLHPLFSRLPPLVADTPDDDGTARAEGTDSDDKNPYDPIPISRIFHITDDLLARYPWDGPIIRGKEIMGPGSVVNTYDDEHLVKEGKWDLKTAEKMANQDVILPGATMPDEPEEEKPQPRRRKAVKRNVRRRSQRVSFALGVLAVGLGIAVYGWKSGGLQGGWGGWWTAVMRSWTGRNSSLLDKGAEAWGRLGEVMKRVRGVTS